MIHAEGRAGLSSTLRLHIIISSATPLPLNNDLPTVVVLCKLKPDAYDASVGADPESHCYKRKQSQRVQSDCSRTRASNQDREHWSIR
jgi:hypothetical protein